MKKFLLAAVALFLIGTGAQAQTTWDLSGGIGTSPGFVVLGTSQSFGANTGDVGLSITAFGLTTPNLSTAEALVEKNGGSTDEIGLGLNNDSSGQHEITVGSAIMIDWRPALTAGATSFSWQFNSVTPSGLNPGEQWMVLGSNSSTISTFTTVVGSGTNDEADHTLTGVNGMFKFYLFEATAGNVLLAQIDGAGGMLTPVAPGVPEPATWAMMLLGFAGLGFAFRRRRRMVGLAA